MAGILTYFCPPLCNGKILLKIQIVSVLQTLEWLISICIFKVNGFITTDGFIYQSGCIPL